MSTYIHQMGAVQRPFSTSNATTTETDVDTFQHIRPASGIDTNLSLVLSRQSSCDSDRFNSSLYSSSSNSNTAAVSTRSSSRSTAHRLLRQRTGSSSNMSNLGSNDTTAVKDTAKQQQLPQHQQQKLQQMPATAQADKAITGRFFAASSGFNQLSLNSPRIGPASASPQLHISQWNTNANSSSGVALSRSSGYSSLGDVIQAARDSCNGTTSSANAGSHQQQQQHHFDTSTDETDISAYIGQAVKVCYIISIVLVAAHCTLAMHRST
jgi:hypothetical protein